MILRDFTNTWKYSPKFYSKVLSFILLLYFFFVLFCFVFPLRCTFEGRDGFLGYKLNKCFTYKICFPRQHTKALLLAVMHWLARTSLKWYIAPYKTGGYRHTDLSWSTEETFPHWIEGQLLFLSWAKFSVARKFKLLKLVKDKKLMLTLFLPPTPPEQRHISFHGCRGPSEPSYRDLSCGKFSAYRRCLWSMVTENLL